jgi:hypothetical protein
MLHAYTGSEPTVGEDGKREVYKIGISRILCVFKLALKNSYWTTTVPVLWRIPYKPVAHSTWSNGVLVAALQFSVHLQFPTSSFYHTGSTSEGKISIRSVRICTEKMTFVM